MPISGYSSIYAQTTTAQDIIDAASREMRGVLSADSAPDQTILFDFMNRVQLTLLRASRWDFLLSEPLYFITQVGQDQYWLGETGVGPAGVVDTLLNLNNVDIIKRNSVRDISNGRYIAKMDDAPFSPSLSTMDGQFRQGCPATWQQDLTQPSLLRLFPQPNNENIFQPEPPTPYCTAVPGGALALRTYYVQTTIVDSAGNESTASNMEALITIPAGYLLKVHTPIMPHNVSAQGVSYNQFNVYASTVSESETLQSLTPTAFGSAFTEPTTGLIAGVAPPSDNSLVTVGGYIIEFRYYAARQIIANVADILQVPDVYRDIACAGVNWLTAQYLKLKDEAQYWQVVFQDGLRQMVRDRNMIPRENDFIHPDESGVGIGSQRGYTYGFDMLR